MKIRTSMILVVSLLVLAGVLSDARHALAKSEDVCPRPAGVAVNPLETPSVTAAQAAGSAENLKAFALAGKRYLASVRPGPELAFSACLFRHEGPWKAGTDYIVTMSTDGRVFFHSGNVALSGRLLKPAVWGAIAAATGAAALPTTGAFGNPDGGALPTQIGGGYAVGFKRTVGGATFIMAAGLDIGESHLAQETVDPGNPPIRADQVVDRASLKTFVTGAKDYVLQLYRAEGRSAFTKAKSVLRDPNGPWRHGPVYLFIMEPSGYTAFHGASPDKYEFQTPTTTLRDQVTGKLILPQIIQAATANEDGGFVKYYFDNPDDDSDSADVPKVTYAIRHDFQVRRADGSTIEYPLIFGAGIYGDPDTVSEDVCPRPEGVAVNPLEKPAVTAAQAAAGGENLKAFALAGQRYLASARPGLELSYSGCLIRNEGPWKAGSTYLAIVALNGSMIVHSANMALSGRLLKPAVWEAIAAATGAAALRTTGAFGKPDGGALPAQIGSGYAIGYKRAVGDDPLILVAGLDIGEAHLSTDLIAHVDPAVRADQVVDRASLKAFVEGARDYVVRLKTEGEGVTAINKAKLAFRDPNGPWRHGPVYLFIMEPSGYTIFHGAFPNKYELQTPTTTLKDAVTGKLILPQIIEAARNPEGGFVQYYFDAPDDDSDSADVPKVTYTVRQDIQVRRPDGSTVENPYIFGAGLYGDPDTVSEDVCPRPEGLALNPLEKPAVTAAQAAGSPTPENLKTFALAGQRYLASARVGSREYPYSACLIRNEGPWKAGSTYLATVSLSNSLLFHPTNMALSGRPLRSQVYGAVLAALGFDVSDPAGIPAQMAKVAKTGAFPKPDGGALPAQFGGGYAVGFIRPGPSDHPEILIAGLDIGEPHLSTEPIDHVDPPVRADQVVDRASLKAFVEGARDYITQLFETEGGTALNKAKLAFRDPNGPWRHGPVYLFTMGFSGYTYFHGAFPDRFEFQTPTNTLEDAVTGKLILPQIIEAAKNPDGGFVQYYFDNPDDDSDSADVPKVTYAVPGVLRATGPDGSTVEYPPLIIGAGFYLGSPEVIAARLNTAVTTVLPQVMRAVTASTVDAVSSRIQQATAGPAPAKAFRLGGAASLSEALLQNGQALGDGSFDLTRLLAGSSFTLPLNAAGTGSGPLGTLTLWGNGDYRNFAGGNLNTVDYDGDVVSANLGVDTRLRDDLLAGVSVTWARGAVDYTDADAVTGEFTSTLTSINPYVGWQASSGLNLWGTAGYGWGEVELDDEMAETQASDLTQQMVAAGVNGPLASSDQLIEGGTSSLRLKGETAFTWADLEGAGPLRSTNVNASRQRLMFEGRHVQKFASGASLTPSFEIGMRYDGGDGETGHSMELGGGLRYADSASGLTVEGRARTVPFHSGDYREWGVSGLVRVDPGAAGLGLALTVQPAWGQTGSGVQRLWETGMTQGAAPANQAAGRVNARLAYGLGTTWGGQGVLTPYTDVSLAGEGSRRLSLGGQFTLGPSVRMSLEGVESRPVRGLINHGVMLRGDLNW